MLCSRRVYINEELKYLKIIPNGNKIARREARSIFFYSVLWGRECDVCDVKYNMMGDFIMIYILYLNTYLHKKSQYRLPVSGHHKHHLFVYDVESVITENEAETEGVMPPMNL